MRRLLALTAAAALVLAACGDDEEESSPPATTSETSAGGAATTAPASTGGLDGRTFVVTGTEGYEPVEGSTIRMSFADGTLAVQAGCNNMSGGYSLDGDVLVVGAMAMTQMACETELMDQDTWISTFLSSGPVLDLEGDTLTLTGEDATLTLTDQEVAEPDLALDGTTWTLESIGTADAVSSVPGGVTATLVFDGAGNVAVDTGCNTGSGTVEVTDTAMLFSPLALTKMACGPDETEVETTMVAFLMGEATYEITSDVLTLTSGPNSLVFRGTPA